MRSHAAATALVLMTLLLFQIRDATAAEPDSWLDVLQRDYPNLLYNPGAEVPGWFNAELPALWQDRPQLIRDPAVARQGAASMRLAGPGTGYTFQSGGVALAANTEYIASALVKTQQVKGRGISLDFTPAAKVDAEWASGTGDWTRIEARFKTSEDPPRGHFRIRFELEDGDVAWVDELSLKPADGQVSPAPAPSVTPKAGTHAGAITVSMATTAANGQIRYTTDGTEPHALSTLYQGPFLLMDRVTLKARTFHNGYRDSGTTEVRYDLQPATEAGVPLSPIDWTMSVEDWWNTHCLNSKSAQAFGKMHSPSPVINVAEARDASPETVTAGIAEALAQLPETGGTLFFPQDRGPYIVTGPEKTVNSYYYSQGAILIHRRSGIHFLSDGAEIRCPSAVFGISSLEWADSRTFNQPVRNFYFRGLTFDGMGQADIGLNFIHASDVLIEDCRFRNYAASRKTDSPRSWQHHPATVVVTAMSDNIWLRNCTFSGSRWGVYWDGVHNGGIIGCDFPGPYASGCILMMTNNDMAPFSPTQRTVQYVVISGNHFHGGSSAVSLSSSNCLIADNRAESLKFFVGQHGRPRSNVHRGITYEVFGNRIVGNRLNNVATLTTWGLPCRSFGERPANLIAGNTATGLELILTDDHPDQIAPLENIVVRDNALSGPQRPQVRLDPESADVIGNIVIGPNRLDGTSRPLIADLKGNAAAFDGVRVRNDSSE